jgi:hypothetical protein
VSEDCTTAADDDCDGVPNQAAAGCVCLPNTTRSCYSGPQGTGGVGICKAGTEACSADGKSYTGVCVGQVLPGTEDCSNNIDDDCKGTYCTQPLWVDDFSITSSATISRVAADGAGNVYAVGYFSGSLTLGASTLISSGTINGFVAKVNPSGTVLWALQYGGTGTTYAKNVAADATGNIVVVGTFDSPTTFDPANPNPITPYGTDAFVLKLDSTGKFVWNQIVNEGPNQGNTPQDASGVAIDKFGDVLITGSYQSQLVLPSLPTKPGNGGNEVYLAKFNGVTGLGKWVAVGTGAGNHYGQIVRVDSAANIFVTGSFGPTMTFGGKMLTASGTDVFLSKFTTAGQLSWSFNWGNGTALSGADLVIDSTGAPIFSGEFLGTMHFGGPNLVNPNAHYWNNYLVRLDGAGNYSWSVQVGTDNHGFVKYESGGFGIAVDAANNVYMAGGCTGSYNLGASLVCGATAYATPFVVQYSSTGVLGFQRQFGPDTGVATATVALGNALWIGASGSNIDFGSGPNPTGLLLTSIVTN